MFRLNRPTLLLLACCCYIFSAAQTNNCSADFNYSVGNNNAVAFYAHDTLEISHRWIFGDGSPAVISHNAVTNYQYAQPGIYEVKHIIERANPLCRDTIIKTITVLWLDQCAASWYFTKDSANLSLHFFNTSSTYTGIKTLRWNFGDGTTADSQDPKHTYSKAGNYIVCLNIETNNGCKSEYCSAVQLADSVGTCELNPKYYYYKSPDSCKTIHFINTSSPVNSSVHFTWNFGDGSSSHDLNPVHNYLNPGKYYVCLVAEAGTNCRKVFCDSVMALCTSCNTTLSYTYKKDSLNCKKINFRTQPSNTSSNTQYIWNFGDGTASSYDINPSHTYNQNGIYRVCLVSETDSSCRKEFCDTVIIKCDSVCNVTARFEWKKDSSNCKKIKFINYSSPITTSTHFIWTFGDGSSSDNATPSHIYNHTGKYMVCLTVSSLNSCTKNYCDSVTVSCADSCTIQPAYSWRQDGTSNKIIFTNLTSGSNAAADYVWKFGDSTTSNDLNPAHVYTRPGVYTVCLVVESGNNCRKEICQQVEIKACNVIARFESKHDSTQWNKIWFANVSSPVNNIWRTTWIYGDSTSSQDYNSFHVYNKPGIYNVCLKVISLNGCSSNYCDTVTVVKKDSCAVKANFSHYSSSASSLSIKFEALYQSNTAQYNWSFGDSTAGAGRIAFHNYNNAGKYNVCLTVKDGQCSVSYCEQITIEKTANGNRVAVFPNPAVNTVSIDVSLDKPGTLSIRFLDGSGGIKSTFSRNGASGSNRFSLPVNNLSHGLYMIEIKSNSGTWFSRFVKG